MAKKIKVGIIGANGYAGMEVLRLIASHPFAELVCATSRTQLGKKVSDAFPALPCDIAFSSANEPVLNECDVVFVALPQTAGAAKVGELLDNGVRVIDISADYRFKNVGLYEKTYGVTHPRPELCEKAVYGLCEVNRDKIRSAKLVANPGCYVTSVVLPMLPLCREGLAFDIIADSKSGVSGAGRKSEEAYGFTALDENFKAYGVFSHRHTPEIAEQLGTELIFTPHLLPVKRGILSTVYFRSPDAQKALSVLASAYASEPYVEYSQSLPEISQVAYTNRCVYSARANGDRIIVVSVLDNLIKGAAGQAVQNMNIMFELPETAGLPLYAPI